MHVWSCGISSVARSSDAAFSDADFASTADLGMSQLVDGKIIRLTLHLLHSCRVCVTHVLQDVLVLCIKVCPQGVVRGTEL